MELVAAFIDMAVAGHEDTDFRAVFLSELRQFPAQCGYCGFADVRVYFLRNKEDFCLFFHRLLVRKYSVCKGTNLF